MKEVQKKIKYGELDANGQKIKQKQMNGEKIKRNGTNINLGILKIALKNSIISSIKLKNNS